MLEKTRRKVWDALNDEPKPEILKGRRITKVKCPVCNSTYAQALHAGTMQAALIESRPATAEAETRRKGWQFWKK